MLNDPLVMSDRPLDMISLLLQVLSGYLFGFHVGSLWMGPLVSLVDSCFLLAMPGIRCGVASHQNGAGEFRSGGCLVAFDRAR